MIVDLQEKLEQLKNKSDMPQDTVNKIEEANQELENSGTVDGLKVGDKAPDFTLPDQLGEKVVLSEELADGPTVLAFYRGKWWPYCNLQLQAYQKAIPEIHDLGANLIAISPQSPSHSLSQQEKEELSFKLLSDTQGEVATKYEVLFEVPPEVKEIYQGFGLDLTEYNEVEEWILPVPAVYVVDQQGIIRFADVNADYTVRAEPQEIIEVLKEL